MRTTEIRQMALYRTVQEIQTYCDDRDYYSNLGYSWEEASLRAYDHLFAARKARKGLYHV